MTLIQYSQANISPRIAKLLRVIADADSPNEACGVIRNDGSVAVHPNSDFDPKHNFQFVFDPRQVIQVWHSHPRGPSQPSGRDYEFMAWMLTHELSHISHIIVTPDDIVEYAYDLSSTRRLSVAET